MGAESENDSLLRAIAVTPALSPPTRVTSAIVIELGRDALAQLQALALPYRGEATQHSHEAVVVRVTGTDSAVRAASCALAIRAVFPKARTAVASGPVEAAALDRASALTKGADAIRIDEQTSALLDGKFETRIDGSIIVLLGARALTPEPAAAADDDPIARAIAAERNLSARRLMSIIFASIALALIGHLVFPALADRHIVRLLYVVWMVPASLRLLAARSRRRNVGWLMHTVYLIDVPMFFAISMLNSQTDPGGTWYLTWCMAIASTLPFFMRVRPILLTATLLVASCSVFFFRAGQAFLTFFGTILIGFSVAVGIYLQARTRELLQRVVGESTERIRQVEAANREVRGLNDELRRQIADRAGQLAAAIARLSLQPPRAIVPGATVEERYRVVERIGAGGMGAVYRVERLTDGRQLALKVLTGVADRMALARFAREAQVAAEIDHPNVVSVLDVDVTRSGMLFLVMELVAGGSLADRRERYGEMSWALPLLGQVSAALAAMHARGIVHRDLKPSNILMDDVTAKVADFGLASLAERGVSVDAPTVDKSAPPANGLQLTRTGVIMGTPLYMAPELAHGVRDAQPSSDIFSLGVVAYELLSKELPFSTSPAREPLNGGPRPAVKPLARARGDLPTELCALVDSCLLEAPEARPSAAMIVAALGRIRP